jgi:hypothetical protein
MKDVTGISLAKIERITVDSLLMDPETGRAFIALPQYSGQSPEIKKVLNVSVGLTVKLEGTETTRNMGFDASLEIDMKTKNAFVNIKNLNLYKMPKNVTPVRATVVIAHKNNVSRVA